MCNQSFCINNFHWINDSIFLGFTYAKKYQSINKLLRIRFRKHEVIYQKKKKILRWHRSINLIFFFTLLQNMKQQIPNHITIYTKKITNSMYTYTQIEHKYTYRSNGLKSKINSIDQMSNENQTVHRKKSNQKKKWWNQNQADQ